MSDYLFMLESHLAPEQHEVVVEVSAASEQAGVRTFMTGGAMRDMLGGFPIRDIDFTVEGPPAKLVRILSQRGAKVVATDENRKTCELLFPNGVRAEIGAAHVAHYPRPAARPQISPATIYDDLRRRDFTVNSIALSLHRASRGLLLDPTNGLGDIERRELRANSSSTLYDDPSRILRMFRLRTRLGFEIDARTQAQYEAVRAARLESRIPPRALLLELHRMASEPSPVQLIEALDRERLLTLFSPALTGAKVNLAGFARLERARQLVPFGAEFHAEGLGLFLFLLFEKLSPREQSEVVRNLGMSAAESAAWRKLDSRARMLERALRSPRLNKASLVYRTLRDAPGEIVLYLLIRSAHRLVTDRIKNYLQRYLTVAQEVTDRDVMHLGIDPGSPKFAKAKDELICARLDGRARKPPPPVVIPIPESLPVVAAGRR